MFQCSCKKWSQSTYILYGAQKIMFENRQILLEYRLSLLSVFSFDVIQFVYDKLLDMKGNIE